MADNEACWLAVFSASPATWPVAPKTCLQAHLPKASDWDDGTCPELTMSVISVPFWAYTAQSSGVFMMPAALAAATAATVSHQIGFVLQIKQSVLLSVLTSHPPASRNPCPTSPPPSPAAPPMIAPPGPAMAPPVTVPTATSPSVLQIDMATSMEERTEAASAAFPYLRIRG